jgi:NADH-quinone oxidoreductase subunit E
MDSVERELDIKHGETTGDGRFSLERVACLGCCALSPVMVVDDDIYGKLTTTKVKDTIGKYGDRREE